MQRFHQFLTRFDPRAAQREGGFTLVELMVVIAILVLVASLVLTQRRGASEGLEITNLGFEVALLIREAQSYGIGVREGTGSGFDLGYGVYLDEDNPSTLILFQDLNKDAMYGGGDTILKELTLGRGYSIARFCGEDSSGDLDCSGTSIDSLSISFVRPNPDAQIYGVNGSGSDPYSAAHIYLISPSGFEKVIKVFVTGQIAVENE